MRTTTPRVIVLLAAASLALAGCASATPTPTTDSSAASSPTPTPSATFPGIMGTQLASDWTCDTLVQPPVIPTGYTEEQNFEPDEASLAKQQQDIGGIACGYKNAAGSEVVLGFAQPSTDSSDALKAYYSSTSLQTDAYKTAAGTAYFSAVGGYGEANVFLEGYWLSVGSKSFAQASDAGVYVSSVIQVLPAG